MKSRYSAYPYVIWMVIFTVVPLLLVAAFAITDSSGAYTLENISAVGEYTPVLMAPARIAPSTLPSISTTASRVSAWASSLRLWRPRA